MTVKEIKSLVLPFTGIVVIPGVLLAAFGARFFCLPFQIACGSIFIVLGLFLLGWTIRMFHFIGKGTLAPWDPTKNLVKSGPYAYTRNPMITGVASLILGESVLFGSISILSYCVLFFLVNTLWFRFCEEPNLIERFGDEYIDYREQVPMWLPRIRPRT
jgi:protein-S-isoprenylcysteine O-methyltransferase Ste14